MGNQPSERHAAEDQNSGAETRACDFQPVVPLPDHPITGRWRSYGLLLLARLKEMYREPEVIFWVFVFPILLALGLGIAFRNKPADVSRVAVAAGPGATQAIELLRSSPAAGSVRAE